MTANWPILAACVLAVIVWWSEGFEKRKLDSRFEEFMKSIGAGR